MIDYGRDSTGPERIGSDGDNVGGSPFYYEAPIKDSGTRRAFGTGAVRDMARGKGRLDLLPWDVIWCFSNDGFYQYFAQACAGIDIQENVKKLIMRFVHLVYDNCWPTALLEYSIHMENGCAKYGDDNWRQGIPVRVYLDSAMRHYLKYLRGDVDECHERAVLWNLFGCLWTIVNKPEMIDAPYWSEENRGKEINGLKEIKEKEQ